MNGITGPSAAIDLAHEPDFRLGGLLVCPSACRVVAAGEARRVEPRVMEVLVRLVRSLNQTVTRDELIACCWGGRFIGDDAVSRVIYQLRNLARGVEPPPFVLETVPKVGFRLLAGDSEGAVVDSPPQSAAPTRGRGRAWRDVFRRRPRMAIAAVALAVCVIAVAAAVIPRALGPAGQNGRVEVMLFEPRQANDPALQRYSAALSDATVRILTSSGVKTVQKPTARDAGGQGGDAEFRVAGTVDREGPKFVINAQVLDRRTGDVLWSRRFDRAADAAIGFQEEAANRIADGLDCAIWHRAAGHRRMSAEVFSLFLNACVARRDTAWEARPLVEVTDRLVRAAPDYSYAHSLHAVALVLAANSPLTPMSEAQSLRRAVEAAAQQALRLDRNNGEAYLALGSRYWGEGHWLEREQNLVRAAELSPSLRVVRATYVGVLREIGRWEEAEAMNRRTIADDPFSSAQLSTLALLRGAAGDFVETEALSQRLDLLDPRAAREIRYTNAVWRQDPDQARTQLGRYADPNEAAMLACHEAYLDRLARARGSSLRGLPPKCDGQRNWRARMLAREGDIDGAYAAIAEDPRSNGNPTFLFYPEMKAFRQDRRFMPLAQRMGLVDYWTKSGRWPDFCAEPDLPYDCRAVAKGLTKL